MPLVPTELQTQHSRCARMADTEPTQLLIASHKTDTMKVRSRDGENIGTVYTYMVNKRTGRTVYAVLSLGGFMGIGKSYYPLPFDLLAYEPTSDEYRVTIDRRLLEGGPSWSNNAPVFDQAYADRVSSYYGVENENLAV
jgi:hypothetical protein